MTEIFSARKERLAENDTLEYGFHLGALLQDDGFRFGFDRATANIASGFTKVYSDSGGAIVEHASMISTEKDGSLTHVNLFRVDSALSKQEKDLKKHIIGYSKDRGYFIREGLAESLSLR